MIPWSQFYDMLSPDVPGCPQEAQDIALRQASIHFCEQSLAWQYEHPDIAVVAGTDKYLFDPPDDSVVHTITYAKFNDEPIDSTSLPRDIREWTWRWRTGKPEFVFSSPFYANVIPMPDASGTLALVVALKPTHTAPGVDDKIFTEYRDAIIHGALSRLLLSPKKPYTDINLSMHHAQMFQIRTAGAGVREARGMNRAPLKTKIMRR